MRRAHPTLLAFVAVSALPVSGLSAQTVQALSPLAPLVGGVWVAEGEAGGLGRFTAERTHAWTLGGRFLRVRQTLTFASGNSIEEDLIIGWDPAESKLRLWSFASDGSTGHGFEEGGAGPNRIIFSGTMHGPRAQEWRTTTFVIDETSFSVLVEVRSAGTWNTAMTMAFRKKETDERRAGERERAKGRGAGGKASGGGAAGKPPDPARSSHARLSPRWHPRP